MVVIAILAKPQYASVFPETHLHYRIFYVIYCSIYFNGTWFTIPTSICIYMNTKQALFLFMCFAIVVHIVKAESKNCS